MDLHTHTTHFDLLMPNLIPDTDTGGLLTQTEHFNMGGWSASSTYPIRNLNYVLFVPILVKVQEME